MTQTEHIAALGYASTVERIEADEAELETLTDMRTLIRDVANESGWNPATVLRVEKKLTDLTRNLQTRIRLARRMLPDPPAVTFWANPDH